MSVLTVKDANAVIQDLKQSGAGTALDPFVRHVNLDTPIPAGTAVIGHVIVDAGGNVIGHVILDTGSVVQLQAGTAVIGHVILDGGTSVIGHVIVDSGAVVLGAGTAVIGHIIVDSGSITADTEMPAAAVLADAAVNPTTPLLGCCVLCWNGATWDRVRSNNILKDLAAVTITTITTVWTPAAGKKFRLMGGCISVSAAASVLFEDNVAGATVYRSPKLLADTPYNFDLGNGKLSAVADNVLKATSSAAAAITGTLYGTEE